MLLSRRAFQYRMHTTPSLSSASAQAAATPPVTVLVCTRDRGAAIAPTLRSILASSYPAFTLLIVDQSADQRTAAALAPFAADPRLRYVQSASRGLSAALNCGLALSGSDIVVVTDDDCDVPPDWIAAMTAPFLSHPRVGVVFCDVVAGPHDPRAGFIPVNRGRRSLLVEDLGSWTTSDGVNLGIGAGMAVRRSIAEQLGGFDPRFGAGSRFRSANELEFALHTLASGFQVYRTTQVAVTHHGFRTHTQARQLLRNNLLGVGAVYGGLLRRGHWAALRFSLVALARIVLAPALGYLRRGQAPRVLGRALWLGRGLIQGLLVSPASRSHDLRDHLKA